MQPCTVCMSVAAATMGQHVFGCGKTSMERPRVFVAVGNPGFATSILQISRDRLSDFRSPGLLRTDSTASIETATLRARHSISFAHCEIRAVPTQLIKFGKGDLFQARSNQPCQQATRRKPRSQLKPPTLVLGSTAHDQWLAEP